MSIPDIHFYQARARPPRTLRPGPDCRIELHPIGETAKQRTVG
jgi:hypothetical protein